MSQIILGEHHPFVKNFKVSVWQTPDGMWRLKWRSFDSEKQDMDVRRFSDAQRLVGHITADARILSASDLEQLECWGETVESMTEWWGSLEGKK